MDKDVGRARRKAFFGRLAARLHAVPAPRLLCFEPCKRRPGAAGGAHLGLRVVALKDVVGSVGRCSEFDGAYLPTGEGVRTKWQRIDRAFHLGEELPPVSLYKIGGHYFVLDGNHRVSVARYHGVGWIDADVTEFRGPHPAASRPPGRRCKAA